MVKQYQNFSNLTNNILKSINRNKNNNTLQVSYFTMEKINNNDTTQLFKICTTASKPSSGDTFYIFRNLTNFYQVIIS